MNWASKKRLTALTRTRELSTVLLLAFLTACGGGGGGSSSTPTPPPTPNSAPTAEAGESQTVNAGETVSLDASASSDSDGQISAFAWTQTEGPQVELANDNQAQTSFTSPEVANDTELVFSVTVTDNDGADSSDSVSILVVAPVAATEVTVSGRILPSASQGLDGDTNDPFNPLLSNDDPDNPQPLNNPTTVGGYVNEPGSGAEGRSQVSGDREDFFLVNLLQGQSINLLVAEFQDADADLYLYTQSGELVDFSIETGERETIVVAEEGTYLVNVSVFAGATNYTLAIGSALTPTNLHYDDVIVGDAIVEYAANVDTQARDTINAAMRMRQMGGGPRRERLMRMEDTGQDIRALRQRLGRQEKRRKQFADAQKARLWETLISIKHLALSPEVRSAEPNYRVRPLATVNDEAFAFQWHYPLINLPGAWDTTVGDPSVIVAVVDTGVLGGHPDLAGQLVPGFDFIRDADAAADGDGIDPNPEESIGGSDPAAVNFHGTHVTGTVAAAGNNNIGVAGVAYGARVMPLRALAADGGTTYDVNQSIRFAAGLDNDSGTVPEQRADIINLSLGGGGFSQSSQNLYNELRALGIVVVAAAGNESTTAPSFPASYDNVISVSAVDSQQRVTPYSNTGSAIDVAAPGGNGRVDVNGDGYPDGVLSTGASDGEFAYTFLSGTSMASPHVAGVIALMKSVNPDLTAADVDRLLEGGALTDDFGAEGRDDEFGHGIINARSAVDAALTDSGGSANSDPRLSSSTSALNFGTVLTNLELSLLNAGGGELSAVGISSNQPWLSASPLSVDSEGLGRYSVTIDRGDLSPGTYEGSLLATSDANDLNVRVLMSITDATESELGQIYLLLFDPSTDEVASQTVGVRDENGYRFELPPAPAGDYQIFAGTDLDNDLLICDAGEACGAFLTIDQPITITINADRDDIEFPIEYLIALPGAASVSDTSHGSANTSNEASNNGIIAGERGIRRRPTTP